MNVPGWHRCPSCKRRLHVTYPAPGISLSCCTCSEPLEPIIQVERGPRPATPRARHEVESDSIAHMLEADPDLVSSVGAPPVEPRSREERGER